MYAAFDRYITSIFNPDDEGLLTLIIFEYICQSQKASLEGQQNLRPQKYYGLNKDF